MKIEVHGAGFRNKGAELMLKTVCEKLYSNMKDVELAIDPRYGSYYERIDLRLLQIFPSRGHVSNKAFKERLAVQRIFSLLPSNSVVKRIFDFELYGLTRIRELQALIDISGFAFTDQWGHRPVQNFAVLCEYYYKNNCPIILMPQAFGPFNKKESKIAIDKVLNYSTVVFARDRTSLNFLREFSSSNNKVHYAPDITLYYPNEKNIKKEYEEKIVGLIPNERMLDQGKLDWHDKYLNTLVEVANFSIDNGFKIRIIIHDISKGDFQLAKSIINRIHSDKVELVTEENPLIIKRLISECALIIGSRYHGLIAAFSNGVPAIGLGWAHKYEELFNDFGSSEFLIEPELEVNDIIGILGKILDKGKNTRQRSVILENLYNLENKNKEMWQTVLAILNNKIV